MQNPELKYFTLFVSFLLLQHHHVLLIVVLIMVIYNSLYLTFSICLELKFPSDTLFCCNFLQF